MAVAVSYFPCQACHKSSFVPHQRARRVPHVSGCLLALNAFLHIQYVDQCAPICRADLRTQLCF